jgi:hypothetical protein
MLVSYVHSQSVDHIFLLVCLFLFLFHSLNLNHTLNQINHIYILMLKHEVFFYVKSGWLTLYMIYKSITIVVTLIFSLDDFSC